MILVAILLVAAAAAILLLCLAFCWNEPVRRGGTVDLSGRKPRRP